MLTASADDLCQDRFPGLILIHYNLRTVRLRLPGTGKKKDLPCLKLPALCRRISSSDQQDINGMLLHHRLHLLYSLTHLYLKGKLLLLHQEQCKCFCISFLPVTDHQISVIHILSLLHIHILRFPITS